MWYGYMCEIYLFCMFFFFNDTATTEIYTLSLHDALPISSSPRSWILPPLVLAAYPTGVVLRLFEHQLRAALSSQYRSEEHTSELQSRQYLVCRLLLEKKNNSLHIPPRRYTLINVQHRPPN